MFSGKADVNPVDIKDSTDDKASDIPRNYKKLFAEDRAMREKAAAQVYQFCNSDKFRGGWGIHLNHSETGKFIKNQVKCRKQSSLGGFEPPSRNPGFTLV